MKVYPQIIIQFYGYEEDGQHWLCLRDTETGSILSRIETPAGDIPSEYILIEIDHGKYKVEAFKSLLNMTPEKRPFEDETNLDELKRQGYE